MWSHASLSNLIFRDSQVYSVGVQVHTDDVGWGIVEVKVSGVHTHDKGTRRVQDPRQRERTQGDIRTLPLERKDHLDEQDITSYRCSSEDVHDKKHFKTNMHT